MTQKKNLDDFSRDDKIDLLKQAVARAAAGEAAPLFDVQFEAAKSEVKRRALLLLDQRARSRQELADRLGRLEFHPDLIEAVLQDLEQCGLIDDGEFARQWVEQRSARRGKSRMALDRELKNKGVDASARNAALAQVSDEQEDAIARQLAVKKASTLKEVPGDRADYDRWLRRILGVLARRGFVASRAMTIAREALDERIATL